LDPRDQTIGRFRVERPCPVHDGGGEAFIARDPERDLRVVLQFAEATPGQSAGAVLFRLKKDLELSGTLGGTGLVRVQSLGMDERRGPFLVRDYVDGPSLKSLPRMEVDLHAALRILVQVAHALTLAGGAGVAPRRLGLDGVHVAPSGQVLLQVFGLAHAEVPSEAASAYQLARAGLELIVGREAFEASSGDASSEAGPPRLPTTLDKGLAGAFARALAVDPAERFPTPAAFVQVLIAEAPLPEAQQQDLLDLMDQRLPLLEDPVVQAWARRIWQDQAEPIATAAPVAAPVAKAASTAGAAAPAARPRRGRGLLMGVAAVVVALAVAGAVVVAGRKPAVLRLDSRPSGAQVSLEGRVLGATPLEVVAPKAGARVHLALSGYQETEVTLQAGESARLVALEPVPPPPPAPDPGAVDAAAQVGAQSAEVLSEQGAASAPAPAARPEPAVGPKADAPPPKPKPKAKEPKPAPPKDKKAFDLFKHLEEQSKG
jgi:hypothetical protein